MTTEELKELAATLNAGEHAGTVEDPIPQKLLYTRTAEDGTKKVYTPAGTIIIGGGSGGSASPATDTVMGIVKLTDDANLDAPAATGHTAITPNGVKTIVDTSLKEMSEIVKQAIADGSIDEALGTAIEDAIASGALDDVIQGALSGDAIKDAIQDAIDSGKLDEALGGAIQDAVDSGVMDGIIQDAIQDAIESGEITGGGEGGSSSIVLKPGLIAPLEGAQNVSVMVQLQASDYKCLLPDEPRKEREFVIATVSEPSNNVFVKRVNANTVSVDTQLNPQTQYKWRCRDVTVNNLRSAWTSWATFTTGNAIQVDTPTVEVQGGTTDVLETPTFTASAFAITPDQGDTASQHQSTTWRLLSVDDSNAQVWISENDTTNKTTLTLPQDVLQEGKNYIMQVIYNSVTYGSSSAGSVQFTTALKFTHIAAPTLTCSDGTTNVMETPTIVGSAFTVEPSGSDTHTWTTWNVLQNGTNSVYKLDQSPSALTTLNIPGGVLKVSQSYTVTCVYNGATYGESDAGQITFTTANTFVGPKAPVLSMTPSASAFVATGTITATAGYVGGSHEPDKAEWEILPRAGGAAIYQSGEVTGAKVDKLWAPFGAAKLNPNYMYKVRCRQHYADNEQGGTWSQWAELDFTTAQNYNDIPAWGRIRFTVGSGGGDLKTSYFRWYDVDRIHITVNSEENKSTAITLNEGDEVCIYNSVNNSTPDLWFKPLNPKEILEPLPLLTLDADGEQPVTDFGGDVGVENENSNRNTDTAKYGLFAECANLTTLCEGLFRNNPNVYCFGAAGGAGNGGSNNYVSPSTPGVYNGKQGFGCFYNSAITRTPSDLFAYLDIIGNDTTGGILLLGGYGGGGGGGGGGSAHFNGNDGGDGSDAMGCFAKCKKLTLLDLKFSKAINGIDVFGGSGGSGGSGGECESHIGGNGGAGGAGSSWLDSCAITTVAANFFNGVVLKHIAVGGKGFNGNRNSSDTGSGGGGGGGGYYGGSGGSGTPSVRYSNARGGSGGSSGEKGNNGEHDDGFYGGGGGGGGSRGGGGGGGSFLQTGGTAGAAYNSNPPTQVDYSSQRGIFEGCTELTSVPQNLLADIDIESLPNTFKGCTKLSNADIRLRCNRIMSAQGFSSGTPTKTTVRVPSGSNTATTFKNDSSTNANVVEDQ